MEERKRPPEGVDLDRVWIGIAAQVWRREAGAPERLAARLLRSPGLARALVSTPSIVVPWLVASAVVLMVGAVVTLGTGQPVVVLLAPGVAAAGFGYAYGPGIDPAWELSQTMAVSHRMVLLARSLAVFAVNAVLGLVAVAASSVAAGLVFGWLIPMTSVSALALAAATLSRSANVGVAAGVAGWSIAVLTAQSVTGSYTSAVSYSLTLPYLAFAVGCGVLVLYSTRSTRGSS